MQKNNLYFVMVIITLKRSLNEKIQFLPGGSIILATTAYGKQFMLHIIGYINVKQQSQSQLPMFDQQTN